MQIRKFRRELWEGECGEGEGEEGRGRIGGRIKKQENKRIE